MFPPPWNQTIFGRYSPKWFAGSLIANVVIVAVAIVVARRYLRPVPRENDGLSIGKKLLFTAVILTPVLAATEIGLRVFYLQPPPRLARPDAGHRDRFHALLQHVDRVEKDGRFVRAYRGKVYDRNKGAALRIICLGGSTTWGHHLEAAQTWPLMLEDMLRSRGYDVEIINAGRHWYTTAHSLTNYVVNMRYYQPDIVVIMHGVNDLARSFPGEGEPPPEWDYGSYQGPMKNVLAGYRKTQHEDRSFTHPIMWLENSAIVQLLRSSRTSATDRPEVDIDVGQLPTIGSFQAHLNYLANAARDDKCRVVMATQAHIYHGDARSVPDFENTMREVYMRDGMGRKISTASVIRAMGFIRNIILDAATEHQVAVADVEAAVGGNPELFMDDFHLNEDGNRVAAEAIRATIEPLIESSLALNTRP
jgi:lysophospholipase L1-like esterase